MGGFSLIISNNEAIIYPSWYAVIYGSAMAESQFGVADYSVLFAMLIISSSIGIYFRLSGGRQKTTSVSIRL